MGRNNKITSILAVLCVLVCNVAFAVDPDSSDVKRQKLVQRTEVRRAALIAHALTYVGIQEATGNNDGKEIERFQKVVGIPKRSAYCTAYVSTMFYDMNIPAPLTGWSPGMFTGNVIYQRSVDWRKNIYFPPGSVSGFYYQSKGRVAHSFFNQYWKGDKYMTIQANTSPTGAVTSDDDLDEKVREGDGIYRKWVSKNSIYVVSDYIGGPLQIYDWRKSGVYTKLKTIKE
jgi:hypothetical protein